MGASHECQYTKDCLFAILTSMKLRYKKSLSIILAWVMATSFVVPAYAQQFDESKCNVRENEVECRKRLQELAGEIQIIETATGVVVQEQKQLSTEIKKLTSEIKKTGNEIKKKSSLIENIKDDIVEKEGTLEELNERLAREKESLKKILRKRYELGDASIFEYILSAENLSDFYEDAPAFSYIQDSLSDSFEIIDGLKVEIYGEKSELEKRREQENAAKYGLQVEQEKIEAQKKDRDLALDISEQKEASLAELKKAREAEANRIRAELIKFQGSGITSRSISFGEAYDFAKLASSKTGVDPAFIMAIMQQETGFGNNVGGCYLKEKPEDPINGVYKVNGIYISSGNPSKKNMIPSNFNDFVSITQSLGRDWKTTPISCALVRSDGSLFGHGGAMGYTQFIPSTWKMVEARVKAYLGISVADPWNPRDAVMATAVFMQDKGARGNPAQNYNTYYNAACGYYGQCSSYASSVMNKTANIQATIATLERDS